MGEINDEQTYRRRSCWEHPATDSHNLGALSLRAASDYVRTFAAAFDTDKAPLYGHLVLARSALEACVVTSWLSEVGITSLERIKRGLSEYVYSATEVARLKLRDDADGTVRWWVGVADSFGWAVTDRQRNAWSQKRRGKPLVDGVGRPSVADGITRLVIDDAASRQIGNLLWSRLSAVSHVTWFGLHTALQLPSEDTSSGDFVTVPVGSDSSVVSGHAFFILKALRRAATSRFTLMGWNDQQWKADCRRVEANELALLRAYEAGLPGDAD
jgi:hypothetical protein